MFDIQEIGGKAFVDGNQVCFGANLPAMADVLDQCLELSYDHDAKGQGVMIVTNNEKKDQYHVYLILMVNGKPHMSQIGTIGELTTNGTV